MSVLDKTEKRDGLAVYWCVDETTGKREYGICFENGLFNIANQSIAESLLLALDMASDDIDSLVTGVPREQTLECYVLAMAKRIQSLEKQLGERK